MTAGGIVLLFSVVAFAATIYLCAKSASRVQRALAGIGGRDRFIDLLAWLDRTMLSRRAHRTGAAAGR